MTMLQTNLTALLKRKSEENEQPETVKQLRKPPKEFPNSPDTNDESLNEKSKSDNE